MSFEKAGDDNNNQIAAEAFRSLLTISPCKYSEASSSPIFQTRKALVAEFTRRSLTDYNFTYPLGEKPNEFVMATYDAVEIFGRLVNESLASNATLSGASLARATINRTFELDTGSIVIDKFGERLVNHCVSDFDTLSRQFKVSVISEKCICQTFPANA
ncbi:hypothetical protein RvY_02403-2 [Ramazzottius varieornatus]|nr:hypothetical protein RvY_02403-2 [Ramazzottius varieornatus]